MSTRIASPFGPTTSTTAVCAVVLLYLCVLATLAVEVFNHTRPWVPTESFVMAASTTKRPRMIRTLESTAAVRAGQKGGSSSAADLLVRNDTFAKPTTWMLTDVNYLNQQVLPTHRKLMASNALFGNGDHKVTRAADKCPAIKSTAALMGKQSRAMYQCAERGLLHVLPELRRMRSAPLPTATPASKPTTDATPS